MYNNLKIAKLKGFGTVPARSARRELRAQLGEGRSAPATDEVPLVLGSTIAHEGLALHAKVGLVFAVGAALLEAEEFLEPGRARGTVWHDGNRNHHTRTRRCRSYIS